MKKIKNYASKTKHEKTDEETDKETDITWMHKSKNDFDDLLNKISRYQADGLSTEAGSKTITQGNTKIFL